MANPRVVLLQLPSPWLMNDRDTPTYGPLYLASALLAQGIEAQVADLVGFPPEKWYIPEGDIYGISFTTPQVPMAKRAVEILRARTRRPVTIIGGGFHPSAMPEWCIEHIGLDYAFVGEADHAIVDFVRNGSATNVIRCRPPDLSTLPPFRRDLVDMRSFHRIGINQYVLWNQQELKNPEYVYEGYLQTGRGCPGRCRYCAHCAVTMGKVRFYPIERVAAEIDELVDRWECGLVYINDDTFNIAKTRVKKVCALLKDRKVRWHCLCRADLLDQEEADIMADSGCLNITFGFETGSPRILEAMDKGETVEDGIRAAEITKRAGMGVRGQMIVGFPGETDESIDETVAFMREVKAEKWGIHAFVPLPGSASWELCRPAINDDFETGYHTIGRPGEWQRVWGDQDKVRTWLERVRAVAAGQLIEEKRAA